MKSPEVRCLSQRSTSIVVPPTEFGVSHLSHVRRFLLSGESPGYRGLRADPASRAYYSRGHSLPIQISRLPNNSLRISSGSIANFHSKSGPSYAAVLGEPGLFALSFVNLAMSNSCCDARTMQALHRTNRRPNK